MGNISEFSEKNIIAKQPLSQSELKHTPYYDKQERTYIIQDIIGQRTGDIPISENPQETPK